MVSDVVKQVVSDHISQKGALLPLLHAVQHAAGCIDAEAVAYIAESLNLSRAEVHGVVSFYHDFTTKRDPRPVIELCRAEACKARGVEALVAAATSASGTKRPPYCPKCPLASGRSTVRAS